jgi:hypothetical protein
MERALHSVRRPPLSYSKFSTPACRGSLFSHTAGDCRGALLLALMYLTTSPWLCS